MSFNEYLSEINSPDCPFEHYFAAANSCRGFVSCFDRIFSPADFDRIYILKGGPGVGKSTLMKQTAAKAAKAGLTPICYHCSSDPYSLDGVVIKEKRIAILDGTAPHTVDPTAAGVKEIIINMGTAWNTDVLYENRNEILPLLKEKNACYADAYRFLGAEKQIRDCMAQINFSCVQTDKLNANVSRLAGRLFKSEGNGSESVRITAALSALGHVRLRSFEKLAATRYFLDDIRDTAHLYLAKLYRLARAKNVDVTVSYAPDDTTKPDGLYFPSQSVSLTLCDSTICRDFDKRSIPYKIINMRRFADPARYAKHREYYRFCEKSAAEMRSSALSYLAAAGNLHEKTETLYSKATDYNKVRSLTDKVISDII